MFNILRTINLLDILAVISIISVILGIFIVLQWTALWTDMMQIAAIKNTAAVLWKVYFKVLIDFGCIVIFFDSNKEVKIEILLNINIYCLQKISNQVNELYAGKNEKISNPRPKVYVDNLKFYHANLKNYLTDLEIYLAESCSIKFTEDVFALIYAYKMILDIIRYLFTYNNFAFYVINSINKKYLTTFTYLLKIINIISHVQIVLSIYIEWLTTYVKIYLEGLKTHVGEFCSMKVNENFSVLSYACKRLHDMIICHLAENTFVINILIYTQTINNKRPYFKNLSSENVYFTAHVSITYLLKKKLKLIL